MHSTFMNREIYMYEKIREREKEIKSKHIHGTRTQDYSKIDSESTSFVKKISSSNHYTLSRIHELGHLFTVDPEADGQLP